MFRKVLKYISAKYTYLTSNILKLEINTFKILTSFCSRLASSSVSKVTNPYPLETPALSAIIFVLTIKRLYFSYLDYKLSI